MSMFYTTRREFLRSSVAVGAGVLLGSSLRSTSSGTESLTEKPATGVRITPRVKSLVVEIDGKLFTEYCFMDVPRPYFYPVIGPTDAAVIRHWPMKEGVPNEEHDHPHHKSLWFTHGSVNGVDFWADGDNKGKIVHEQFTEVSSGPRVGVIVARNKWVAPDGKVVCTDERTHRFYNRQNDRIMDFEVTIRATNGKVTFGDTKEGSLGIRLAPTMQAQGKVAQGHIINSDGLREEAGAWGKRAAWCDYYGPVNDQMVGVAIFDHPDNPRHPTWWHVRAYGLFAANPFGQHDFEKKPAGIGDLVIPDRRNVTFRWRFYIHKGDATEGKVADHYREYAAGR
jgi:hypothetical protein